MGLDSYWELPDTAKMPKFRPKLHLCGGMLSGNGAESFRGKVYAEVIEGVSSISLYQDLPNDKIKIIASALQEVEYKHAKRFSSWGLSKAEYEDLRRMFIAYAKAGAVLKASW